MPERTKGQRAVISAGLIVVGGTLVWLAVGLAVATAIGKAIAWAEDDRPVPPPKAPLLGVVPPRQPDPAPAA